ncbi:MAG: helix-turn-helix domain-containing protein [Mesorhizobium sp.]|uniref:helix-turn-helix domain-containing protein n=1 Tax=Mesorhizobium sp. TaxID=1871066 RepID=UPI001AC17AC7|nr:helix-turn-helix domain-containing protein [Mesorhizobium sp.]MBN9219248.1 helix-turn-helix domain-containing protein [Mesorhizobium sp.]
MNSQNDTQPAFIDCYRGVFPEDDPQSVLSYSRIVSPAFDFDVPSLMDGVPFFATSEIYPLPQVTVSRVKSGAGRFTRTIRTMARHGMDQILVVCYTRGHFDLTIAGKTRRIEAGDFAFLDLSQEMAIEAPVVENVSLAVSRRRLEPMVPFLDDAHGFVRRQGPLTTILRGVMENVIAVGPDLPVSEAGAVADTIIQLATACLEPLSSQQNEARPGRRTISLAAIRAAIEQRLSGSELTLHTLIDEFGITRSTLYRMFEPLGGVSAYINERRLRFAFRRMADTTEPEVRISQLAFDLGFSHPSAFTRAFKKLFGLSPKDVRSLASQSKMEDMELLASRDLLQYLKPIERRSSAISAPA